VTHQAVLALNGIVQAALLVVWLYVRHRIKTVADDSKVAFTSAQYSLSFRPPTRHDAGALRSQVGWMRVSYELTPAHV